jgi:hypothetical protein
VDAVMSKQGHSNAAFRNVGSNSLTACNRFK